MNLLSLLTRFLIATASLSYLLEFKVRIQKSNFIATSGYSLQLFCRLRKLPARPFMFRLELKGF